MWHPGPVEVNRIETFELDPQSEGLEAPHQGPVVHDVPLVKLGKDVAVGIEAPVYDVVPINGVILGIVAFDIELRLTNVLVTPAGPDPLVALLGDPENVLGFEELLLRLGQRSKVGQPLLLSKRSGRLDGVLTLTGSLRLGRQGFVVLGLRILVHVVAVVRGVVPWDMVQEIARVNVLTRVGEGSVASHGRSR